MASTSQNATRGTNASTSQSLVVPSTAETQSIEIDSQVRAMVNYILCHSAHKVPIKHNDLMPLTDNKYELNKRFPFVCKLLAERYGIKIIQLEGTPKRYICVSEAPTTSIHELTAAQRRHFSLLYIILLYIFLRGNRIEEDKLYAMLKMLGIDVHEEHAYFGDGISKLIEDTFVKQQYLKRSRSQLNPYDDPKTIYTWGLRAKCEFTYAQIVQSASKLFGQEPAFFEQQLRMAEGLDNPETLQQDQSTAGTDNDETGYMDCNTEPDVTL